MTAKFWVLLTLTLALGLSAHAADINQGSWSEIDNSNTSAPPAGWPQGMLPIQVEPTGRGMMGAIKRWYDHNGPTVTSAGTANAQTLTYPVAPTSLALGDTFTFFVGVGLTNTGPATLNVNALGVTAIVNAVGASLTGGELTAGAIVTVSYTGSKFQISSNTPVTSTTTWIPGSVAFATSATQLGQNNANLFWDNVNNRLGIGTNTPAYNLDVHGTAEVAANSSLAFVVQNAGGGDTIGFSGNNTINTSFPSVRSDGTNLVLNAASNGDLYLNQDAGNVIHFRPNADVIDANNNFSIGGGGSIVLNRNALWIAGLGDGNHEIYNQSPGDGEVFSFHNYLNLSQNNLGSRLFIASTGFVGINNASPAQILDVGGNVNASGAFMVGNQVIGCGNLRNAANSCSVDATNASNLVSGLLPAGRLSGGYTIGNLIVSNANGGGGGGNIGLDNASGLLGKDNGGTYRTLINIDSINNVNLGDTTTAEICFRTTGSTCSSFINGSGNFAVTHGYAGYVNPGVAIANTFAGTGTYFVAKDDGSLVASANSGSFACTMNASSGTAWSCSSDRRKKDRIATLAPSLAVDGVMALKPVEFSWKSDTQKHRHLGFIAQDVEQVFPQLVGQLDDGTKTLDYTGLIAPMVATIQRLSAHVDALEKQVAQLRRRR